MRGGGNWLPLLGILIALFFLFKGIEWGVHYLAHRFRHWRHLHHH